MEVKIEGGNLIITMPVNDPLVLSKSQKSYLVATSNGPVQVPLQVGGKALFVGVNAYVTK